MFTPYTAYPDNTSLALPHFRSNYELDGEQNLWARVSTGYTDPEYPHYTIRESLWFGDDWLNYRNITEGEVVTNYLFGNFAEQMVLNSDPFLEPITQPVPEPATFLLLGTGLLGAAGFRRKFKK